MIKNRIFIYLTLVFVLVMAAVGVLHSTQKNPSAILQESRDLTRSYEYLAALQLLDEGLNLYPDNPEISAEFQKTTELYIMHEISNGYRQIDHDPHDIEAYLSVSKAFLLISDRFKALEILTEGTFENPHSSALWQSIADIEFEAGRPLEAKSALREAQIQ